MHGRLQQSDLTTMTNRQWHDRCHAMTHARSTWSDALWRPSTSCGTASSIRPTPCSTSTARAGAGSGGLVARGRPAAAAFSDEQQLAPDPRPVPGPGRRPTSSPSTATRTASATSSAAGTAYRAVTAKPEYPDAAPLAAEVQAVLDEFVRLNRWHQRQQEIVRRQDRDGECFLRLFCGPDGITRVRFVEPAQVATPPRPGRPTRRPASASRPSRTTWRPCWATASTASGWTPPRSSTARRTSTPT